MSISERERQTLESIENGLVLSAPKLASMLAIFTRLTASEKMPDRGPVRRASSLGAGFTAGPPAPGRPRRIRLGRAAGRWLWLVIVVALLALVLLDNGTGRARCPASPRAITACGHAPVRSAAHPPGGS